MIFHRNASDSASLVILEVIVVPAVDQPRNGVHLTSEKDTLYAELCEFTRNQFNRRFSCDLTVFYPDILSFWRHGELKAVVGIRGAQGVHLFLERYLEAPVEVCIPAPSRQQIVEVGGFAAVDRTSALPLMRTTAEKLLEMGYEQVVCTANKPIRACLARLNIPFVQLAEASEQKLGDAADNWGTYYKSLPLVLSGSIEAGNQAMTRLFGPAA